MKPRNSKPLSETFSLTSYIIIEAKSPSDSLSTGVRVSNQNDKVQRFSVSTLILPTKEPIFITVGFFMMNLLTEQEKSELYAKEHININTKKVKANYKFLLNLSSKALRGHEGQEKYIELEPDCLLLPREIAKNFSELFRFKTKNSLDSLNTSKDDNQFSFPFSYTEHFCLLTLKASSSDLLPPIPRDIQFLNISDHPFEGQTVYIVSSPFALGSPKLYKNTFHVAHISKVAFKASKKLFGAYKKGCIFLVNNLLRGNNEGSPVFNEHFEAIGLILGSISPYQKDSISFSVCLSILPLMDLLFKIGTCQGGNNIWKLTVSTFRPFIKVSPIKGVLSRIVKIVGGTNVGSGVLISSKGYILTNRHVVKSETEKEFTIEISYDSNVDFEYYRAELVAISKGDLDIALLKVNRDLSEKALKMLKSTQKFVDHSIDVRYLQGHEVYALGYTFTDMHSVDFRVLATRGCLSKVIVHQNAPLLILTSCPVFNGFSGGAIVSNRGEFLGLITYNFTHSEKGILNDLNFSYCSNIFKELQEAMEEKDEKKVKELDLWGLEDSYLQKMACSQTIEYVPKFEIESKL